MPAASSTAISRPTTSSCAAASRTQAVIIDFGIAKDASAGARTIVGNDFAGKYEYAAPEQMHGRAEPRSDLYALGASLLATFRGRVPDVGGSPGEVVRRKEQPLDTAGVPEPLKALIDDLDAARPGAPAAERRRRGGGDRRAAEARTPRRPPRRRRRLWPVLLPLALPGRSSPGLALPGVRERLFSRPLPVASPYLLTADRRPRAPPRCAATRRMPRRGTRSRRLRAGVRQQSGAGGAGARRRGAGRRTGAPRSPSCSRSPRRSRSGGSSSRTATATLTGIAADAAGRDAVTRRSTPRRPQAAGLTPEARIAAGPLTLTWRSGAGAASRRCGPAARSSGRPRRRRLPARRHGHRHRQRRRARAGSTAIRDGAGRADRRPAAAARPRACSPRALRGASALLPPVPAGRHLDRPRLRRPRRAATSPASTPSATTR